MGPETTKIAGAAPFGKSASEGITMARGAQSGRRAPMGAVELQPFRFVARDGRARDVERGTLFVPENRGRSDSRLIQLAFVRLPATTTAPTHPIVYLAGGPGESGIEVARGRHFDLFDELREVSDVIALDQRGAGESRPSVACGEVWEIPFDSPADREALLEMARERSRACAERLRGTGADLAGYNTVESADDIESLRIALGVQRLFLWGISYGTHLAFSVLKRHGDRVAGAVLGGAEGPNHTYKLPSQVARQLGEIGRRVSTDPHWGVRIPDFPGLVASVLEGLERNPVSIELADPRSGAARSVTIGRFDIEYLTAMGLADTRLVALLPRWYEEMSRGDFSALSETPLLARYFLHLRGGLGRSAMGFCMDCSSGATSDRQTDIEKEVPATVLGRTIDFPFPEICDAWDVPDLGDGFREPAISNVPVLFFSGSLDCRTPLENIQEVRRGLPRSAVVAIDGAGHTDVFLSSPRVPEIMRRFLCGGEIGETSLAAEPPFEFTPPRGVETPTVAAPEKPLMLFDGECAFCVRQVVRMRKKVGDAVSFAPYQDRARRIPGIELHDLARAVHLVEPDGTVTRGAQAIYRALSYAPSGGSWFWAYRNLPGFAAASEWGYRWIARHRGWIAERFPRA
jgi:pimeloyl-ACP methyl ester carboxylesterase/predicted DCC family thiol-disulfide oxidoreductase YuxK